MLVHKFVNVFMKRRMDAEMRKHERVEQAFQRIKATTVYITNFMVVIVVLGNSGCSAIH